MPRSRVLFTAPIVLAILIIGMFAIRSRGNDKPDLDVQRQKDCSPVARADAAATKPGESVSIDPLANDTDADGDPLVFQIGNTTGGTAIVDDGATPTDAADDRVNFTPAIPPPDKAVIEYQAVDPDGVVGESIISVYINPEGVLPAGVQSDPVTDQKNVGDDAKECSGVPDETTTTEANPVIDSTTTPTTLEITATTSQARSTSPKKKSTGGTSTRRTTTTRPTSGTTATTQAPATTAKPTTTTAKPTTTTQPGTTTTNPCGPPPQSNGPERDAWEKCIRDHAGG